MCDITLFRKAYADFQTVETLFQNHYDDACIRQNCCYFMQQCIEKILKGYLEFTKAGYQRGHSIGALINATDNSKSRCVVTAWVRQNHSVITQWESDTRYPSSFSIEAKEVQENIIELRNFMAVNGVQKELLPEITESIRQELSENIPLSDRPRDDFEWNILYKIFYKQSIDHIPKFDMEEYFSAYKIADKKAEIDRLKSVLKTEDMEKVRIFAKECVKAIVRLSDS